MGKKWNMAKGNKWIWPEEPIWPSSESVVFGHIAHMAILWLRGLWPYWDMAILRFWGLWPYWDMAILWLRGLWPYWDMAFHRLRGLLSILKYGQWQFFVWKVLEIVHQGRRTHLELFVCIWGLQKFIFKCRVSKGCLCSDTTALRCRNCYTGVVQFKQKLFTSKTNIPKYEVAFCNLYNSLAGIYTANYDFTTY